MTLWHCIILCITLWGGAGALANDPRHVQKELIAPCSTIVPTLLLLWLSFGHIMCKHFVCGAYSLILWFNVYVTWSEPCAERINCICTNIAFIVVIIWWYDYIRLQNPQIFFQLFYELCRHIVYVIWSYHVQNELIAWWSLCANIFLEHEAYSFVKEGVNKFLGLLYDSKHINLSW